MSQETLGWDARDQDLYDRLLSLPAVVVVNSKPCVLVDHVEHIMRRMAEARHRYRAEELESHLTAGLRDEGVIS